MARHVRSYARHRFVESPSHIEALGKEKRAANELRGRDRLRASCSSADALLGELARRGQVVGPHTLGLLRLLDQYGAQELDAAMAVAVERGAFSAGAVGHLCDQRRRARRAPPPIVFEHPDPRVRQLRVPPHRLDGYDALSRHGDDEEDAS